VDDALWVREHARRHEISSTGIPGRSRGIA
jgi:hypothetical protein